MGGPSRKQADIVRILRTRILRGVYNRKLPSGRDLARELGTSHPTVELALGELRTLGIVSRQSRLGTYVVPPAERKGVGALMTARLVCEMSSQGGGGTPWYSGVIVGFERACTAHGLPMVLHYSLMDGESDEAMAYALDAGASGHCVGTCLMGMISMRQALRLRQAATPVVAVDWEFEEPIIPSVSFDNLEAGALLAKHLFSLGHRRIAFVEHEPGDPALRDRITGMQKAFAAFGLPPMQRIHALAKWRDLGDRVLSISPRPTAVVTLTALFADFLICHAATAGVRVPRDLSVASFYDPTAVVPKHLTVAALDFQALGRLALEALLDEDLWKNPAPRLVPVDRVVGDTCGPPPR